MSSSTILPSIFHFLTSSDATWSFASIAFMATFLVFFLGYLLLEPSRRRRRLLAYTTAFSLFFAFKANGLLMLLLPTTTLLSWWITRRMAAETTTQRRRGLLVTNILITLLPLLYFKYSGSFVSSISAMMGENLPVGKLFMPLGISFYTFQAISYTVDVYRRRFPATTPLLEYTFYLTFFPLLMAGPITRAEVLIPQEHADPLPPRGPLAYQGLWLILLGIVKKVIIADYIAQYNNWIFDTPTDYTGFECLMGVIGFSVQIFCDFSGYSDLAIGLAALMGFRLQDNFRFPYQATSLTEFWHRWHISLSTWFRDYVYIPLGGNRRGELRTYLTKDLYRIYCQLLEECGLDPLSGAEYERRKIPYEDVFPMLYLKYRLEGGNHSHKNIKHLVIDEMQDYSYLQYTILANLFSCKMTILGDRAQTMDVRQQDVLKFLPRILGRDLHKIEMNKSYRNTVEIAEYAAKISGIEDLILLDRHGKEVAEQTFASEDFLLDAVQENLNEEFETAALLTMTEEEALELNRLLKLRGAEVAYIDKNSSSFKKGLTVTTFYLAKGLEFDQVFAVRGKEQNPLRQQAEYICATRALHELYMYEIADV